MTPVMGNLVFQANTIISAVNEDYIEVLIYVNIVIN